MPHEQQFLPQAQAVGPVPTFTPLASVPTIMPVSMSLGSEVAALSALAATGNYTAMPLPGKEHQAAGNQGAPIDPSAPDKKGGGKWTPEVKHLTLLCKPRCFLFFLF